MARRDARGLGRGAGGRPSGVGRACRARGRARLGCVRKRAKRRRKTPHGRRRLFARRLPNRARVRVTTVTTGFALEVRTRFQDKKCGDDCQYLARVYPPSLAKEMIATAAATAARAVGTRTAPAVVGAVRSFWADVPMAPKVRADRSSRSVFVGGHRRSVLLSRGLSPLLPDTSLTSRCPVNVHLHRIPSLASLRCSSRTRTPRR